MDAGLKLFDLSGLRALITGSSQGIGFALAKGLLQAGATVVLNGRDAEKLAAAATTLGRPLSVAIYQSSRRALCLWPDRSGDW